MSQWGFGGVDMDNNCLTLFNPIKKEQYNFITSNWSNALVTLLNSI